MKVAVVACLVAAGVLTPGSAFAQTATMKDMPAASASQGVTHSGTGTVKKVDAGAGMVTLDHGPIASLKWPAMSMEFSVADKKVLEGVKPGTKVEFRFAERGKGRYVITEMKGRSP